MNRESWLLWQFKELDWGNKENQIWDSCLSSQKKHWNKLREIPVYSYKTHTTPTPLARGKYELNQIRRNFMTKIDLLRFKLDRIGPVDNRAFTD